MDKLSLLAFGQGGWGDEILWGLAVTLALALATFPVAIALSFLVHWARSSSLAPVRIFGQVYATLFKSLPEILTLLILYYQAQAVLRWLAQRFLPQVDLSISPFLAGLVALSLVISAYGSEIVRAAMNAVGKGQFEAAAALGLSRARAFHKVILPQLWRHALPGFGNLWVILLKDTSLVSVIALSDLTHVAVIAINTTREPFVFYLAIGILYVALVTLSARAQKMLEKRASRGLIIGGGQHA
ncbi:ABC transporter permease subunit [Shinella sp. CPCC 101442]|uniref:ABC transporter permease n=1 Tax=Shinella sp. CPCC 101442 TaxID=2932265 RepID=UPI0021531ECA|nr:ABC transporter permease subunit [Shinella sp. CPCC 101442]MCR6499480.1 ABC transporter permease subunit [Shinella sp. CPCC 101442]